MVLPVQVLPGISVTLPIHPASPYSHECIDMQHSEVVWQWCVDVIVPPPKCFQGLQFLVEASGGRAGRPVCCQMWQRPPLSGDLDDMHITHPTQGGIYPEVNASHLRHLPPPLATPLMPNATPNWWCANLCSSHISCSFVPPYFPLPFPSQRRRAVAARRQTKKSTHTHTPILCMAGLRNGGTESCAPRQSQTISHPWADGMDWLHQESS